MELCQHKKLSLCNSRWGISPNWHVFLLFLASTAHIHSHFRHRVTQIAKYSPHQKTQEQHTHAPKHTSPTHLNQGCSLTACYSVLSHTSIQSTTSNMFNISRAMPLHSAFSYDLQDAFPLSLFKLATQPMIWLTSSITL